ncbi:TasA family protein [Frigoribacterium salinisoli]
MTERHDTARHRAAAVGASRRLGSAIALLAAAVLAGALATGGTYALLSSSTTAAAGTVRSGSAQLVVTATGPVDLQGLVPGSSVVTSVLLRNEGTVPLALSGAATDLSAAWDAGPDRSSGASLDELRLRITPVDRVADCRAGLGGLTQYLRAWATPTPTGDVLAQGASRPYCVEVLLDADAPTIVQGAVDGLTLTVAGTQVRS